MIVSCVNSGAYNSQVSGNVNLTVSSQILATVVTGNTSIFVYLLNKVTKENCRNPKVTIHLKDFYFT